ncbi:hypothetical protein [Microvirga makkahensis]|uniref:Uncharacterized protein n=1 Tax=Microvirga makkahensis TaxID=1128670 RepID=A0A7X3MQS3_9HYPH|nr:hypothetical protein [Microvirga makkahensis]MXQ11355.1 hypothetical protein [Microvirga makkahensis]
MATRWRVDSVLSRTVIVLQADAKKQRTQAVTIRGTGLAIACIVDAPAIGGTALSGDAFGGAASVTGTGGGSATGGFGTSGSAFGGGATIGGGGNGTNGGSTDSSANELTTARDAWGCADGTRGGC